MKKIKFFKRANCGNCKKMEEVISLLSKDIEVEIIDSDSNKDEVNKLAPRNNTWQLPLIATYEDDVVVHVTTGLVSKELIELPFQSLLEIEAMSFRTMRALEMLKKDEASMESLLKSLGFILQAKESAVEKKPEVVDLPVDPSEETACDSCQ